MAGICFYFEPNDVDVWSGRRLDLDAWNYAAKAGGVDRMVVINLTDQVIRTPDSDLAEFRVVDAMPPLDRAVYLVGPGEAAGASPLWTFDHDVDWYCFGPAQGWQFPVSPKLHVPQANRGALHSVHVATAVMLHRHHVRNP